MLAGIMLANGYWWDIEADTWQAARFPPYPRVPDLATPDVFGWRGRPTVFGNPSCDGEGNCEYVDVVQYDPEGDSWVNLGKMSESKRYQAVVEVPEEFCQLN